MIDFNHCDLDNSGEFLKDVNEALDEILYIHPHSNVMFNSVVKIIIERLSGGAVRDDINFGKELDSFIVKNFIAGEG